MTMVAHPYPDCLAKGELDDLMTIMEDSFEPRFGEGWSRSQCSGMLGDRNSWVSITSEEGEPTGFALSRMIVDEAELLLIAVRPAYRGKGIGAGLLQQVCETAAAKGAKRLHLEVRDGNAAANLYQASGFQTIGRRKNYYRGGNGERFDAITLSLQLDRETV
ncbi:ribosomal protein S18-alanine N-acetyltransferase [Parasphingopyxis lamellibrachiae]|uniref:Ribosomal-protein-alanine N-acetyltransferase n=1 Tax=Parasphingopyxis lamellibrachiae TaxID=680125 RepID=A0A3D9FKB6_9SPHN|nr:ribosomal protein S18-alanine N-acetyltransferase [Parasphingopyxis lamellibrachiae]RED17536.1 ribosomal-protein-alanine N-acetyltransferase [Parasphingopyxis lamellibrachiae]